MKQLQGKRVTKRTKLAATKSKRNQFSKLRKSTIIKICRILRETELSLKKHVKNRKQFVKHITAESKKVQEWGKKLDWLVYADWDEQRYEERYDFISEKSKPIWLRWRELIIYMEDEIMGRDGAYINMKRQITQLKDKLEVAQNARDITVLENLTIPNNEWTEALEYSRMRMDRFSEEWEDAELISKMKCLYIGERHTIYPKYPIENSSYEKLFGSYFSLE